VRTLVAARGSLSRSEYGRSPNLLHLQRWSKKVEQRGADREAPSTAPPPPLKGVWGVVERSSGAGLLHVALPQRWGKR